MSSPTQKQKLPFTISYSRPRDIAPLPSSIRNEAEDILNRLMEGASLFEIKSEILPELLRMRERYPNIPSLGNHLSIVYERLGNKEELIAHLQREHENFPDYFIGNLNYARILLHQKKFDKLTAFFHGVYQMHELYPKRKDFHITEVIGFYTFMAEYQSALGYKDAAEAWLREAAELEPDHPEVRRAAILLKINPLKKVASGVFAQKQAQDIEKSSNEAYPMPLPKKINIEDELINELQDHLPIPCTILPQTCKHLQTQKRVTITPTTKMNVIGMVNGGFEGGVVCALEYLNNPNPENALALSITHLNFPPKHPMTKRITEYQRARMRDIQRGR
jgi:tetratricopeptide (TPR) repeat protein